MTAASDALSGAGPVLEAARLRVLGAFRPLMICWAERSSARATWLRVPIARRARAKVLENLRRLNFMVVLHSGHAVSACWRTRMLHRVGRTIGRVRSPDCDLDHIVWRPVFRYAGRP